MFMLHRLQELSFPKKEMMLVLKQQILSIAEQAVPFWGPRITKTESHMLEGILKTGLHIIFQEEYVSFKSALRKAKIKSLAQRRKDLIFKFAKSAQKSEKFSTWFSEIQTDRRTQRHRSKNLYKEVTCRTTKFARSSIPVLTKALQWHPPKIYVAAEVY